MTADAVRDNKGPNPNEVVFLRDDVQNKGMSKGKKFTIFLAVILGLGLILAPVLSSQHVSVYESHVDAAGTRMEHMWTQVSSSYGSIILGAGIGTALVASVVLMIWLYNRKKSEKSEWKTRHYVPLLVAAIFILAVVVFAITAWQGADHGAWDKASLVLKDSKKFLFMGNTDGIALGIAAVVLGALGFYWVCWLRSKDEDKDKVVVAPVVGGVVAGAAPRPEEAGAAAPKKPEKTAEEIAARKQARAERQAAAEHRKRLAAGYDDVMYSDHDPRTEDIYTNTNIGARAPSSLTHTEGADRFQAPSPLPEEPALMAQPQRPVSSKRRGTTQAAQPQPAPQVNNVLIEDLDIIPPVPRGGRIQPPPPLMFAAQPLPGPQVAT